MDTSNTLKFGTLSTSGETYCLRLLDPSDAESAATFHTYVQQQTESHFLMARNKESFDAHFAEGHKVLAVTVNGKIIAQTLLTLPKTSDRDSGMTDMKLPGGIDTVAVICGVTVDPAYRRNGLQGVMTEAAVTLAKNLDRQHVIAEVAVDNQASWATFLKQKMSIVSMGRDNADGTSLYNLHITTLAQKFNDRSAKRTLTCSQFNLKAQKVLLSLGYKAESHDPAKQQFIFSKPVRKKGRSTLGILEASLLKLANDPSLTSGCRKFKKPVRKMA